MWHGCCWLPITVATVLTLERGKALGSDKIEDGLEQFESERSVNLKENRFGHIASVCVCENSMKANLQSCCRICRKGKSIDHALCWLPE